MRNHPLYCSAILLSFLFSSTAAISQIQKIYLQPKATGSAKQSQFLDSLRFIPLEDRSDINISSSYGVDVTEQFFLLRDYINSKLFIYSKEGRFIKEINYKKLGNVSPTYNDYNKQLVFFGNNKNYTLTQKDQIKIKLNWTNPRNKKYFKKYTIDLNDPSLSLKKAFPDQNDIIRSYHYFDDFYWQGQIITSPLFKDSQDYEIKIYKNNQLVKGFFPYNRINETRFLYTQEDVFFYKTNTANVNFVVRPYCDTVYKMVDDSLFPVYQIVLPLENSLPPSFFTTPFKNKTERDNFYRNNGWMLQKVLNFYETQEFVYFMVRYFSNFDVYVHQKKTNTTYRTKNIRADSSQYNLQLLADYNLIRKGDWLYKPQQAGTLLAFFEQNKNVAIPRELEKYLKDKPRNTAPVIVAFKFKNTNP
jgi:hypothetical protein